MRVFVTGNQGYIGPVLTEMLALRGHEVIGFDTGYYAECALAPLPRVARQIRGDVRRIGASDLKGMDAVIHLAALSNDPLGELDPRLTEEINYRGTLRLAEAARAAGVRRFVYSSSQSMYGIAAVDHELDEDTSEKRPLTAYARTKWDAEQELLKLTIPAFTVVALRPSTVFGASPLLRTDIVFNNFLAAAHTTGRVAVRSDGTPWRPAVHVRDVAAAFIAALEAPAELVSGEAFNVGTGNWTVRELAEAAARAVPGSRVVYTGEAGKDERTYRISFTKINRVLNGFWRPEWDLARGAHDLVEFLKRTQFTEEQFRGRTSVRLKQIRHLVDSGKLSRDLFWI